MSNQTTKIATYAALAVAGYLMYDTFKNRQAKSGAISRSVAAPAFRYDTTPNNAFEVFGSDIEMPTNWYR
jgi:uncharacterized membrane protein YebE (DUF533 family)